MKDGRRAARLRERGGKRSRPRASGTAKGLDRSSKREIFEREPGLLHAFRRGEDTALAAIYGHYAEAVSVHLVSLARATGMPELSQPSAIADLLQEVFVRAFSVSARNSYDVQRPYAPYLNAIAKNCFVDLLRKRRRDMAFEIQNPLDVERDRFAWNEDVEKSSLAFVEVYVGGLAAPLKDVYEQRFVLGLSQEAASRALGISRRTLRTAEAHLKRGLRNALSTQV